MILKYNQAGNLILLCMFFLFQNALQAQTKEKILIKSIPYELHWENTPVEYSTGDNLLLIVAGPKTDMFRDPNVTYNADNAPKLLFRADSNFVLTTSIEHIFKNKWDGGAIILREDSLHWIKFCFEKDYTGARRVVSVVTKDVSDDCNSAQIDGNKVFYKIAKAGNVVTLYMSVDGIKWFLVRHLQFEATPGFTIGFLAQSPTGDRCEVAFLNIKYEIRKILDPYAGE